MFSSFSAGPLFNFVMHNEDLDIKFSREKCAVWWYTICSQKVGMQNGNELECLNLFFEVQPSKGYCWCKVVLFSFHLTVYFD